MLITDGQVLLKEGCRGDTVDPFRLHEGEEEVGDTKMTSFGLSIEVR